MKKKRNVNTTDEFVEVLMMRITEDGGTFCFPTMIRNRYYKGPIHLTEKEKEWFKHQKRKPLKKGDQDLVE